MMWTGPATAESPVDPADPRIVYRVVAGEIVDTGEVCETSGRAIRCYMGDTQTLLSNDMEWVVDPVPGGNLLDATPSGWWVLHGDAVIPADEVASSVSPRPTSLDELVSMVSAASGESRVPTLLGVPWLYVWAGLAGLVLVACSRVLRRRMR